MSTITDWLASEAPEKPTGPIGAWLHEDLTRLRVAQDQATSPETAARILNVGLKTGLPREFVTRNLDAVERAVQRREFSPERFKRESPAFAAWAAENPNHWAVVADDYENLSSIEWALKAFGAARREGLATVELNRLYAQLAREGKTPEESDEIGRRIAELEKQVGGHQFGADGWWSEVVVETARQLPQFTGAIKSGLAPGLGGAFVGGGSALLAGQAGPQVLLPEEAITVPVAASIGFTAGFSSGASGFSQEQITGASYREFLSIRDAEGNPLDPGTARIAARASGFAGALLEVAGLGLILKNVPGVGALTDRMASSAIKRALQTPTFRRALTRFAGGVTQSVGGEIATEVGQEAITILAGELAKEVSPGDFPNMTAEQIRERLAEIAKVTLQSSLIIGGAGPTVQLGIDAHRSRVARQQERLFAALGENAQASKLRERLPPKFRELVDRIRKDGGIDAVRVDVERFDEYFQSQNLDPEQVAAEVTGSADAYREAKATGGDLVIPVEAYAEKLAATEHHNGLMKDLRLRADDMTVRESEIWQENREQILKELSEGATESGIGQAPEVYQDVLGQLLSAGHEQFAAERQAELFESVFATLGQRTGIDPLALYQRYGLRISRPLPEVLANVKDFDTNVDPLIDRLRSGDIPSEKEAFGPSLVEFLRERGGLRPDSELDARDVGKQFPGLISKQGDSLDGAAQAAAEAGYIASDYGENELLEALDRELFGDRVHSPGQENTAAANLRGALLDLENYLISIEADVSRMDNAQIKGLVLAPPSFEHRVTSNQEGVEEGAPVLSADGNYPETTALQERPAADDAEQGDLFAAPDLPADEERQEARDNYKVLVRQEETSQIAVGLDTVKTVEDAAHVLAPFRRHAQESFFAIVTDKDDKIVNVIRHSKGGTNETSVYPAYIAGAVLATPGAANVWFGHNHPSGNDQPSNADVAITKKLVSIIRGSDVRHRGHAVVAAGGKMGAMDEDGNVTYDFEGITPAPRRQTVSVTERILRGRPESDDVVTDADAMRKILAAVESPEGVLLLDNAHAPLGFVALSAAEMEELRPTGGSSRLLSAIHYTNASAIAIKTTEPARSATQNMAGFAFETNVHLLDHLYGTDLASHARNNTMPFSSGSTFRQGKRGSITFNEQTRQATIKLFKAADLSTVLHESGHLYLEILGDLAEGQGAPESIVADYGTLLNWLGVENRQAIGVDQHEQFARGFEAYLREGKAPSAQLQRAFAAFRAWLINIYRKIRQLDVELDDDVRGVFDRLVATDDAINAAQESQNYVDLFSSPEAANMTPEAFKVYRAQVEAARLEAEQSLTRQLLEIETREAKAWWKAERAKMRDTVVDEVHKMRVYRALSLLRLGQHPDGRLASAVKLDRKQLVDLYGKDFIKRLPGGGRHAVYANEGGVDVDTVAGMFGYDSGDALVQDLVNARPMKDLIEAETDARMQEAYPDPMTDGSLADKAMRAVHNTERGKLLAAEMRTLRKLARQDRPIVRAAQQARRREEREAREALLPDAYQRQVIKAAAERMIAAKKVREVRPHTYRVAEAKASRAAFRAAATGDYETAYREKRRQLLNHELYRAAEKAKAEAESIRTYLKKFERKRVRQRLGKAGEGLLEQIDLVLSDIDLRRVSGAALDRNKARVELMRMIDEGALIAGPETIERLQADQRENWIELSVEQFRGMRDIVKQLETRASRLSAMVIHGEKLEIDTVAAEIADAITATNKVVYPGIGQPTGSEGVKHSAKQARDSWLRPAAIARVLDGREFGPMTKHIIVTMRRAYVEKLIPMERKARDDMAELYNRFYTKAELGKFTQRKVVEPLDATLSKSDLLSIALNWGAQGNRDALLAGQRLDGMPAYTKAGVIEALETELDTRDWEFVQAVWDYLDSYWPALKETEQRRRGIAPKKVPASPFTIRTKDGQELTIAGGYYPLAYDPRHGYRTKEREFEDHYKQMSNGFHVSVSTRAGATHERTKSGAQVVRLGLGNIDRHLREIIRDMAIGDEVNFVKRVMDSKEFRNAMKRTGNDEAREALDLWLKDSAVGELPAWSVHERAMAYVRTGFTKAKLGWNVLTTLLQLTGIAQTTSVVGAEAMSHGVGRFARDPRQAHKHIMATSHFMQLRYEANTWNKDVADTQTHLGSMFGGGLPTKAAVLSKGLASSYFWPIAKMQMVVDEITWLSAYWKGVEKEGLSDKDAVLFADATVEKAQTSGIYSDRSGIERGSVGTKTRQSQFIRLWTTLISYMLAKSNIAYEKGRSFGRKPTLKGAVHLATDVLLLYTVEAMMAAMIYGKWPDEDDDEPFLVWTAKETGLSALSGIPFVREVYGARFNSGTTPVGVLSKDLFDLYTQAAQGENDRVFWKEFNNVAGTLFHYPSSQTNRLIDSYWRDAEGEEVEVYEFLAGNREYGD